jgi:transcriptional regulator with XRE-family HTH domain
LAKFHEVDVHVAARVRQRRTLLGMSQEKVGTVGLTSQQIQKYERASSRIGPRRLDAIVAVAEKNPSLSIASRLPPSSLEGTREPARRHSACASGSGSAHSPTRRAVAVGIRVHRAAALAPLTGDL